MSPWIEPLCVLCGAAEWVRDGMCMYCAIKAVEQERTEDKMDIIERAEQWLASIDENALFDSEGAEPLKEGPELVRALASQLRHYQGLSRQLAADSLEMQELLDSANDAANLYKKMYEQKAAKRPEHYPEEPPGINDAWPGDPGAAD